MQLSIEQIQDEMVTGGLSPGRVSDFKVYLAALYSMKSHEREQILLVKLEVWLRIRDGKNSDTAADRAWDATTMGLREMSLKMEQKRIDKLVGALSTKLRVMEGEARN